MPDSNITKRALASALKELMNEVSFKKINVASICERCGMNRKSFYYHFKDKYDLVNWIFDTDFISLTMKRPDDNWEFIEMVCVYFYENRNFYRKVLNVKGQNSFSDHLREFIHPLVCDKIEKILDSKNVPPMCIDFFADGIICAIERWLQDTDCLPPEQFVTNLKQIIQATAMKVYDDMKDNNEALK